MAARERGVRNGIIVELFGGDSTQPLHPWAPEPSTLEAPCVAWTQGASHSSVSSNNASGRFTLVRAVKAADGEAVEINVVCARNLSSSAAERGVEMLSTFATVSSGTELLKRSRVSDSAEVLPCVHPFSRPLLSFADSPPLICEQPVWNLNFKLPRGNAQADTKAAGDLAVREIVVEVLPRPRRSQRRPKDAERGQEPSPAPDGLSHTCITS